MWQLVQVGVAAGQVGCGSWSKLGVAAGTGWCGSWNRLVWQLEQVGVVAGTGGCCTWIKMAKFTYQLITHTQTDTHTNSTFISIDIDDRLTDGLTDLHWYLLSRYRD